MELLFNNARPPRKSSCRREVAYGPAACKSGSGKCLGWISGFGGVHTILFTDEDNETAVVLVCHLLNDLTALFTLSHSGLN